MAVLIKNMEMPKACFKCPFLYDNGDYPFCIINQQTCDYNFDMDEARMDTCPLEDPSAREEHSVFCPYCGSTFYEERKAYRAYTLMFEGTLQPITTSHTYHCFVCNRDFAYQDKESNYEREVKQRQDFI